uniref:Uncharacterized protein n=1 Tax=Heterorhabditis bacteriophora TaxID=37862 RepID=A0A1I7WKM5_HETBA
MGSALRSGAPWPCLVCFLKLWGERLIEPSSSWFPPKFPPRIAGVVVR